MCFFLSEKVFAFSDSLIDLSNSEPRTIEEPTTYTEQPESKTQHVIDIVQPDIVQHTTVGSPVQSAQLRSDKTYVATSGGLFICSLMSV